MENITITKKQAKQLWHDSLVGNILALLIAILLITHSSIWAKVLAGLWALTILVQIFQVKKILGITLGRRPKK